MDLTCREKKGNKIQNFLKLPISIPLLYNTSEPLPTPFPPSPFDRGTKKSNKTSFFLPNHAFPKNSISSKSLVSENTFVT